MTSKVQQDIDSLPFAGSVPGQGYFGGPVEIPPGETKLETLRVRSGVHIRGGGAPASILNFGDMEGIALTTGGSGNGPFNITIEGVTIRTTRGRGAYIEMNLAGEPDKITFKDCIFDVQAEAIDLRLPNRPSGQPPASGYRIDLLGVDHLRPGGATLVGPVRMATLDAAIKGQWRGGPVPRAFIDLWGQGCSLDLRRLWVQSYLPENALPVRVQGGNVDYEAKVEIGVNFWPEMENPGYGTPRLDLVSAFCFCGFSNPSEDWPIRLRERSELHVDVMRPHGAYSKCVLKDTTSKVFINGVLS